LLSDICKYITYAASSGELNPMRLKTIGKTGGSRRKFVNKNKGVIILHESHPGSIVKNYVLKQIIEKLKLGENE
jgi:predicted RNA binding protein YcfA (HicA-like mRNA interferase family)